MGRNRGILALKFIENKRARKTAYVKRKKNLMKKAHEFSVLCGADTCVIVYDGFESQCPETWPPNRNEVERIISRYESKDDKVHAKKTFGLSDFLENQEKKIDSQMEKVKLESLEAKYHVNNFTEEELQSLASTLDQKIEMAKKKLGLLEASSSLGPMPSVWQSMPPLQDHGEDFCLKRDDAISLSTDCAYRDNAEASYFKSISYGSELISMDDYTLTPTPTPIPIPIQFNYGYEQNDYYHQHDHGMDILKQAYCAIHDHQYMNEGYDMKTEQFPAFLHGGYQGAVHPLDLYKFSYPSENMAKGL